MLLAGSFRDVIHLYLRIMVTTRNNENSGIIASVDQSVFAINAAAPKARQIFFKWFWLANPVKRVTQHVLKELVDTLHHTLIMLLPLNII